MKIYRVKLKGDTWWSGFCYVKAPALARAAILAGEAAEGLEVIGCRRMLTRGLKGLKVCVDGDDRGWVSIAQLATEFEGEGVFHTGMGLKMLLGKTLDVVKLREG